MSTPNSSSLRRVLNWVVPFAILALAAIFITLSLGDKGAPQGEPTGNQTTPAAEQPTADGSGEPSPEDTEITAPAPEPQTLEEYVTYLQANRGPDLGRRDTAELSVAGPVDAPVVMVVFSDYQCKFCSLWSRDSLPTLLDQYVASGDLRIEWRDVNVFGEPSRQGAIAAHAAAQQGKFWEMHEAMLPDAKTLGADGLTPENLTKIAGDLGLDTEQFVSDMSSAPVVNAVARDELEGQQIGVTSTPSFLINGIPVSGAQPVEMFQAIVDAELAAAN